MASGLQSARMSRIKKEEVTVLDWDGAERTWTPGCRWDSMAKATPCLELTESRHSLDGEGGEEQRLLTSELGLSSKGDLLSPISGSPWASPGLPALWDKMVSIPNPLEPSIPVNFQNVIEPEGAGRGESVTVKSPSCIGPYRQS